MLTICLGVLENQAGYGFYSANVSWRAACREV